MSAQPGAARTALLVIDMQHAFCDEQGCLARSGLDHRPAAAVIAANASLLAAARAAGLPVLFTRYALADDYRDAGRLFEVSPMLRDTGGLIGGTWDAEIVAELAPRDGEVVLDKTRYSAFWGTDLAERLAALGVATVIISGVTTNVCVEGTARDAFAHDLRVVIAADATAAVTPELHEGSLLSMGYGLGTVTTVAALENLLSSEGTP